MRSRRGVAPRGVVFPRFLEAADGRDNGACLFKFSTGDAVARPNVAHMLRWKGSRLVSHGGVGFKNTSVEKKSYILANNVNENESPFRVPADLLAYPPDLFLL